jgi:hypothetical protein
MLIEMEMVMGVGAWCVVVVMVMASFSSSLCLDGVDVLVEIYILEVWRLWSLQGGRPPPWWYVVMGSLPWLLPYLYKPGGSPIASPMLPMT